MSIEAMKLALEAVQDLRGYRPDIDSAIETLRAAIQQAEAQQPATGEPVYWEWRHLGNNQFAADFGQWSEWKRVEARNPIFTAEDELRTLRRYIADGYKYELRALYDHPAPSVPGDVARDAERLNDLEALVKSKGTHGLSFDYCRHVEDGYVVEKGFRLIWRHTLCERKPTLREAIDAAMLAAK